MVCMSKLTFVIIARLPQSNLIRESSYVKRKKNVNSYIGCQDVRTLTLGHKKSLPKK